MLEGITQSVPAGMGEVFYSNLLEAKMKQLKELLQNKEACERYEKNIVHAIRLSHKSTIRR